MTDDDIFIKAIEFLDAAERARYLDAACQGNAEQKAKVLSLLHAHQEASRFLATPAMADLRAQVQELRDNHQESERDIDSSVVADETTIQSADSQNMPQDGPEPLESGEDTVEKEFRRYLSPATRPNWLGRLAHYEIEEILGHGAFGVVAKAFDEKLHRVVAIKMLRPELASTSPPRKRFLREARAAAAVTHENIVGIYAVEEEPVPYLVMEFVPGQTLQARLNQKGPLEIAELLQIAVQVARGLAAAHKAKLIHRDIKPANILLTCDPVDRTKISDFGLARAVDDASLTSSGVIAGTPLYMAPEQARGETLDSRADLFSLGSVMYQMASGRPPFRASTTMAVLKRVCDDTPRPIKDLIPETPKWLSDIIFRLLEKSPDDRFQSADEVVQLLESCQLQFATGKVSISELDHSRKPGSAQPADRQLPSFAKIALLLTATALLILIPVGYVLRDTGKEAITRTDLDSDTRNAGSGEQAPTTSTGDADQQILSLIELMGGRVNAGPTHSPGDKRNLQKGETAALSGMQVDMFFGSDNRNASDENLEKLSSLLIQRPDIQLRVLHLADAPITNRGLKSLKGLPIGQLSVGRTRVNGDEWANDLGGYQIRQWCLIPNVSTSGLLKFLAAENVKNMDLPVDKLTPDIFAAMNTSPLQALGLQGPGPKGWPAPEILEKLKDTNLTHVNFVGPDLPQNYLQTFHDFYPHLNVGLGSGTVLKSTLEGRMAYWKKGRRIATGRDAAVCSSVPDSYRIEFSTRGSDSKMFLVVFPVGDSSASLIFGGFRETGECLNGLSLVDGKGLNEYPTKTNVDLFADNKSHRVVLTVTPQSVNATVDGKVIVEWSGEPDRLSIYKWLPQLADCSMYIKSIQGEWDVTDLTIEAIGDADKHSQTDQEIIDFVKSTGGRLTQGDPPLMGTSLTAWPSLPALASDVVHFDFRRSKLNLDKQFGDEQLTRFAELMKLRPDVKIGVLNLVGTTVSNIGLLTLEQVPITELMIYNTRVNSNQIAEQLATFPISDWDFGSSISSDSLAVLAKNPNLRGISLDSETVDAQSLSFFANSKLRRLQLFGRENRSLPTVDQLSGLTELTDLHLPNYELESDPKMLRSLQESLPGVKIHTKSYADRLPLPREYPESDLEIISLVESVGGEIHQYRPEGLVRVSTANNLTLSRSMGAINIAAYSKPAFDDAKLLELTALLKQRPDIDLICVHFPGTSISNVGLRSLKGFKISQLFCGHTRVNGDEIANEAPEFKVSEWGHVPRLTERGFSKFLESPHVIAIDIPAGDVTPTVIRNAAQSNLRHFGMIDLKASDLPPAQSFSVLTEIQVLALQSNEKIPQEYLQDLHIQVPQAEIRCGVRTIPPDDDVIQARLFAGRQISNGVPAAIARDVPHSYLLEFKARRITGKDAIGIRFPIADNAATILFSAFTDHTEGLSGLALIDGVDLPKSPHTKQGNPFADGKDHLIRIFVTPRTVTATVDNTEYVRWEGDPARLKPYAYLEGYKSPLFIRTWADFYVTELKLEAIDPAELTEPSEEKPKEAN